MLSFRFTIKRFNLCKLFLWQQNTGYKTSAESRCIFMLYIISPPVYHSKALWTCCLGAVGHNWGRNSSVGRASNRKSREYLHGFESPVRQGIFLPVNFQCRLWCPCSRLCASDMHWNTEISVRQTLAAIPMFGYMKMLHTLIGMGSAPLMAPVSYPGKVTQTSCTGQSTKNI